VLLVGAEPVAMKASAQATLKTVPVVCPFPEARLCARLHHQRFEHDRVHCCPFADPSTAREEEIFLQYPNVGFHRNEEPLPVAPAVNVIIENNRERVRFIFHLHLAEEIQMRSRHGLPQ
jgi:hypothetical protein